MLKKYRRIQGTINRKYFFSKLSDEEKNSLTQSLNTSEKDELLKIKALLRQDERDEINPEYLGCTKCNYCSLEILPDAVTRSCTKGHSIDITLNKCPFNDFTQKKINTSAVVITETKTYFQTQQ